MPTVFENKVYDLLRTVPKGFVTTYGEIARALGCRAYQAVGNALRKNPFWPDVPCHRVVASNGTIGGFDGATTGKKINDKIAHLRKEGVRVENGMVVDFTNRLFRFDKRELSNRK